MSPQIASRTLLIIENMMPLVWSTHLDGQEMLRLASEAGVDQGNLLKAAA